MVNKTYFEFQVLSRKLIAFKEKHNLTYQELGNAAGVDKSHIHRVLNMETLPSFTFLIRLARYMQVPLFSLFVPTEVMLQEQLCTQMQQRLVEWNWDMKTLAAQTGIPLLRLVEILTHKVFPSCIELDTLHQVLQFEPALELDVESSLHLICTAMSALGCSNEQKKHVLTYIHDQVR